MNRSTYVARDDDFESFIDHSKARTKEGLDWGRRKEGRNAAKKRGRRYRDGFEGGDCHSNRLEIIQRAPLGPGSDPRCALENGPA